MNNTPSNRWLWVHSLAIAFSLAHLILDWAAGLLGTLEPGMTGSQVLLLIISAGMYALWASALVLASRNSRPGLVATILLSAVASLNGFSIVACPPPCAGLVVADIAHIGSLIFCLWAIFESWRALKRISRPPKGYTGPINSA